VASIRSRYDARVTISDTAAECLRQLRTAHLQAIADADKARLAYYRALVELHDQGATQEQIADVLGVSRVRVQQLLVSARMQLSQGM
jgi:DNA-directed RNA polymerase specialized sigma subunit